jgi:hypothetical protein
MRRGFGLATALALVAAAVGTANVAFGFLSAEYSAVMGLVVLVAGAFALLLKPPRSAEGGFGGFGQFDREVELGPPQVGPQPPQAPPRWRPPREDDWLAHRLAHRSQAPEPQTPPRRSRLPRPSLAKIGLIVGICGGLIAILNGVIDFFSKVA